MRSRRPMGRLLDGSAGNRLLHRIASSELFGTVHRADLPVCDRHGSRYIDRSDHAVVGA